MDQDRPIGLTSAETLANAGPTDTGTTDTYVLDTLVAPAVEAPRAVEMTDESDFKTFYGLKENPFSDSVNPSFFYKTNCHELAFIRMILAVRNDVSLGLVTGPSGSGKTLISQLLLQSLDPALYSPAVVLASPAMSKTALLREILHELNEDTPQGSSVRTQELLNLLQSFMIDLYHSGKKLALIIDESHFLTADSLHILRTISNIEVPEHKLSTCILFAEDRFLKRLSHPSFESLRKRIYLHGELEALNVEECRQYIKFRLMRAGRMHDLFDDCAVIQLHAQSGGICRRINKFGLLSLLEGTLRGKSLITADIVAANTGSLR